MKTNEDKLINLYYIMSSIRKDIPDIPNISNIHVDLIGATIHITIIKDDLIKRQVIKRQFDLNDTVDSWDYDKFITSILKEIEDHA